MEVQRLRHPPTQLHLTSLSCPSALLCSADPGPDIPEGSSSGRLNIKRVGQKTGHVTSRSTGSPIPASPETGPDREGKYDTQGQTDGSALTPTRTEVGIRVDALVKSGTQERGGVGSDVALIGTEEGHATSHDRVDKKELSEGRGQGKGQGAGDDSLIAAVKSQQAATATAAAATAPVTTSYWSIMTEVLNESVRAPAATFFTSLYSYTYAYLPKAVDAPQKATNFIPALGIQVQVRVDDEARLLEAEAEGEARCNTAISNG